MHFELAPATTLILGPNNDNLSIDKIRYIASRAILIIFVDGKNK